MSTALTERRAAQLWVQATLDGRLREGDGNPFTHYVYCTVLDPMHDFETIWDGWVACTTQKEVLQMLTDYPKFAQRSLMERDWFSLDLSVP